MTNKVAQGEVESLTGRVQQATPYLLEIETAQSNEWVRLGKSKRRIQQQGQRFYDGDRTRITLHQGETLYALSPNSDAEIDVRPEGFDVDLFPRRSVYEIENVGEIESLGNLQNHDAVQSFTYDPNEATNPPSNEVPPGIEVAVQASYANENAVRVGRHELGPGDAISLRITNTDVLDVTAPTAGDVVNVTWEA